MLIISGAAGNIGIYDLAAEIAATIPELQPYLPTIELVRQVLGVLASLGGNIVLIGGFFLTIDKVRTGKFLIGTGAGMGIFGLIINIAEIAYTTGFGASFNWIIATATTMSGGGVLLTILARLLTRKPKKA
jgi:hypothetical protein